MKLDWGSGWPGLVLVMLFLVGLLSLILYGAGKITRNNASSIVVRAVDGKCYRLHGGTRTRMELVECP